MDDSVPDGEQDQIVQSGPADTQRTPPAHRQAPDVPYRLIILVALAIIAAAGAYYELSSNGYLLSGIENALHGQQTPTQTVLSALNRTQHSNFSIRYALAAPPLSSGLSGELLSNMTLEAEQLGSSSKMTVDIPNLLVMESYSIPNASYLITCIRYPSQSAGAYGVACTAALPHSPASGAALDGASFYGDFNSTLTDGLKFVGNESVLGRQCHEYSLGLNASQVNELEANTIPSLHDASDLPSLAAMAVGTRAANASSTYTIGFCIDSEYGYLSAFNLSSSSYSAILGKNKTETLLSLEATSYSQHPDPKDFEIPANFVQSNFTCTSNRTVYLSFIALSGSYNTTVRITNLTGYNTTLLGNQPQSITLRLNTKELSTYGRYNASGTARYAMSGPQYPYICVAGSCQLAMQTGPPGSCYFPAQLNSTGYNYTRSNYSVNSTATLSLPPYIDASYNVTSVPQYAYQYLNATRPLIVFDYNASHQGNMILIGNNYSNMAIAQVFAANPIFAKNFMEGGPNGPEAIIDRPFGNSTLVVGGYDKNDTIIAANRFVAALKANSTPAAASIGGVSIVNGRGQPAARVVIGTYATPSDWTAAVEIASEIKNLTG